MIGAFDKGDVVERPRDQRACCSIATHYENSDDCV